MSKVRKKQVSKSCIIPDISFHDVRKVHPALRTYLGYCLHKVTSILKSEVNLAFEKHNLQGHHIAILSIIGSSKNEINQMKLCEESGIDKASMVKIIDHLERYELIDRVGSKQDRRVKNLTITKKGVFLLEESRVLRNSIESNFLISLNKKEILSLKKSLLKILDHHQSQ